MTLPGLIAYLIDRYIIEIAILSFPTFIAILYIFAKDSTSQKSLLDYIFNIFNRAKIYNWLGWIASIIIFIFSIRKRRIWKDEIHRLAEEKKELQNKLNSYNFFSGHKEGKNA